MYEGRTALMYAAFMGNQYVVDMCLKLGGDVQARDNGGMNALEINAAQSSGDNRQDVDDLIRKAMQAAPVASAEGNQTAQATPSARGK